MYVTQGAQLSIPKENNLTIYNNKNPLTDIAKRNPAIIGNGRLTRKLGLFNQVKKSKTVLNENSSKENIPDQKNCYLPDNLAVSSLDKVCSLHEDFNKWCSQIPMETEDSDGELPSSPDIRTIALDIQQSLDVASFFPGRNLPYETKQELCSLIKENQKKSGMLTESLSRYRTPSETSVYPKNNISGIKQTVNSCDIFPMDSGKIYSDKITNLQNR
jgi:hypothetical protein